MACALAACGRLGFDSAGVGSDGGADGGAPVVCTDGDRRVVFDNHCYFSFDLVRNATDAKAICADAGAHLATIANVDENDAVLSLYAGGANQWIGLTDEGREGSFIWRDGSPFNYMNWSDNEPNNMGDMEAEEENCVEMAVSGRWNDRGCDADIHFVCERDPEPHLTTCTEGQRHLEANGRCYSQHDTRLLYDDAITACNTLGAQLVSIHDVAQNALVNAVQRDVSWIGLDDRNTEGTFLWNDATPFDYTQWMPPAEPNDAPPGEDCVVMFLENGNWNDIACLTTNQYVCERDVPVSSCTYGDARVEIDGRCYWRVDTPRMVDLAEADCAATAPGAHLASIPDDDAQLAIRALFAGSSFLIGGTDSGVEGTFTWINGDPFGATQWAPGEPGGGTAENCILYADQGWNDVACAQPSSYVCERK